MALKSPGWPPGKQANGIATYTAHIVAGLQKCNARPYVITDPTNGVALEAFVVSIHPWRNNHGWAARLLARVGMRIAPDYCHLRHWADTLLDEIHGLHRRVGLQLIEMEESFGLPSLVARRCPIPIVVRMHGPWFLNGTALGVKQDAVFRRRVSREGQGLAVAAGISAPSRDVLDRVRSFYGLELADAEVIPNPIPPVPLSERWSLKTCDPNRILFVGRFDLHKGGDIIIEAFARIAQAHPSARLTFVGPDRGLVDENGHRYSLPDFLRSRLPDAVTRAKVEWLGQQTAEEIFQLRRQCLVTVICSRYENFPMTSLEAMACGCPIVATNVGGLAEMIQHNRNGLLCPPADAADLADNILRLMRGPALAQRLGRQAAIDAECRYHPEVIARHTLDFYRKVIWKAQQKGCNGATIGHRL